MVVMDGLADLLEIKAIHKAFFPQLSEGGDFRHFAIFDAAAGQAKILGFILPVFHHQDFVAPHHKALRTRSGFHLVLLLYQLFYSSTSMSS